MILLFSLAMCQAAYVQALPQAARWCLLSDLGCHLRLALMHARFDWLCIDQTVHWFAQKAADALCSRPPPPPPPSSYFADELKGACWILLGHAENADELSHSGVTTIESPVGAGLCSHDASGFNDTGDAEVTDLDSANFVHEQIGCLEIPMDDPPLVQIVHAASDLRANLEHLGHAESTTLDSTHKENLALHSRVCVTMLLLVVP